ncbi:MAG TPA: endonuclease domain-containing protein [Aquella sp.]|nr:endonuclease domain-containing protein [Aquella sp.]
MDLKICTKCYAEKSYSEFYRAKSNKDGLRPFCKACDSQIRKECAIKPKPVLAESYTKKCRTCLNTYNKNQFAKTNQTKDGLLNQCLTCQRSEALIRSREYLKLHPTSNRHRHYIHKYNLTFQQIQQQIILQDNKCTLCQEEFINDVKGKSPVVDHNHITGKVRGIIHHHCNSILGFAEDRIDKLQSAINYLITTQDLDMRDDLNTN